MKTQEFEIRVRDNDYDLPMFYFRRPGSKRWQPVYTSSKDKLSVCAAPKCALDTVRLCLEVEQFAEEWDDRVKMTKIDVKRYGLGEGSGKWIGHVSAEGADWRLYLDHEGRPHLSLRGDEPSDETPNTGG